MIPVLKDGKLANDLDANGKKIQNLAADQPVPASFCATGDSRLSDARVPTDGSVTNAKVNASAAIAQTKLALTGAIPPSFLGTTSTTAVQGDLGELLSHKAQANGYASLDGTGKIPSGQLPALSGTGTVTSVALSVPAILSVSGSPVTTNGTLAVTLANAAATTWFGNATGGATTPSFNATAIPTSLIPSLDAAKITTGTFNTSRIPVMVGVGGSHAPGAVPDPGASGTATDYLARDGTFKAIATGGQPIGTTTLSGTAPAINWALTDTFKHTLTGNTIYTFSGVSDGFAIMLSITNTGANYTVSFPGTVKWPGGSTPVQTIGVKTDVWAFVSIGGTVFGNVVHNY